MLKLFILTNSRGYNGDIIAACDPHDRSGRGSGSASLAGDGRRNSLAKSGHGRSHLLGWAASLAGDGLALETRDVAAGAVSGGAVDRSVLEREQHRLLLGRIGIVRDLDVAGRNRPLEIRAVVGDRAQRQ